MACHRPINIDGVRQCRVLTRTWMLLNNTLLLVCSCALQFYLHTPAHTVTHTHAFTQLHVQPCSTCTFMRSFIACRASSAAASTSAAGPSATKGGPAAPDKIQVCFERVCLHNGSLLLQRARCLARWRVGGLAVTGCFLWFYRLALSFQRACWARLFW